MADLHEQADLVDNTPTTLSEAARVGAGIKDVRERLGWKLSDVAERIRIQGAFLIAIEEGDLSSLPGAAYRIGFVRSYAQTLGLDGEEILQRFRNAGQIGEVQKEELNLLTPVPDSGVPKGAVILIGLILIICGYGLWFYHTEQTRKTAQNAIQIPAKLQPLAVPAKVIPTIAPTSATASSTSSAAASKTTATTPQAPNTPANSTASSTASSSAPPNTGSSQSPNASTAPTIPSSPSPAVATSSDSSDQANTNISPQAPNQNNASVSDQVSNPGDASAPAQAPVNSHPSTGLTITATQPSWIQVTAPNGTILFSKVLNTGESWPVPQMPGLKLTTGNAGGTVLSTNGTAGQPLGGAGVVLHDYQLTPPTQGSTASPAQGSTAPSTQGSTAPPTSSNAATATP